MSLRAYLKLQMFFPELFDNQEGQLEIITDLDEIEAYMEKRRQELAAKNFPLHWADIGVLADDRFLLVIRDLVRFPNGTTGGYIRVLDRGQLVGGSCVAVLPVYQEKIIMLRQYHHGVRRWCQNIPRGFAHKGHAPDLRARGIIAQEIQGTVSKLTPIGIMHPDEGIMRSVAHLFVAEISEFQGECQDNKQPILTSLMSVKEFERGITNKDISDSFTLSAYTKAKLHGLI